MGIEESLTELSTELDGELHTGSMMRTVYATDASVYQEMPTAVAIPLNVEDLIQLVRFARKHRIGLIPRTAGTSLAGQVVGNGIVVDVSKHFTEILEVNQRESWVRVQPGVIRNELNRALLEYGMLFGPETSTQNRAMMGGMLGNNSCGSNSIRYGSVRDHVLEVTAILSDGSVAVFGPLSEAEFNQKCDGFDSLETRLYRDIQDCLSAEEVRSDIKNEFPKESIQRRNTGYALDKLLQASCFDADCDQPFHFGNLIAGSEGTLCLVTEMKLRCLPLPPNVTGLQCAHFENVDQALRATQIAVKHDPYACELIDKFILDCTERSIEHRENRFFIQGDPGAVLVTEIRGESERQVNTVCQALESELREAELGYAFPVLFGEDSNRIWELRKAGLGLLSNMPGDAKPAPVVEDTAVDIDDLPQYIADFNHELTTRFGLECVHYAHAGSGEIHLRPILNLKTTEGQKLFREVAETIASLVKRYRGSLSGEHGDGRLRGEFLEQMIGAKNYALIMRVKNVWDPDGIFNPGKIVETPPMDQSLRFSPDQRQREPKTVFDWSSTKGITRAAEMCNGSGDCRKLHLAGGTMCPSYMATRDEKDTTRARANMLRHVLTDSDKNNPFDDERLKEVMDLCLSCKGCKKECPSTVDMAKLKAEFQQHYRDVNGSTLRDRLVANFSSLQRWASIAPWLFNAVNHSGMLRRLINRAFGFHPQRSLPRINRLPFRRWFERRGRTEVENAVGEVVLFCDEFTNHNDLSVGIASVELLERLGYRVLLAEPSDSGRTLLSKGFVRRAKAVIEKNVDQLSPVVSESRPLVGMEPSSILTFRDEAIDLCEGERKTRAQKLAENCFLVEEFLSKEASEGRISAESFVDRPMDMVFHAHCFHKAIGDVQAAKAALSLPKNARVKVIPSGCCGMAGAFGYEAEHFDVSMKIGELVLFPSIRSSEDAMVVANGTSCRHQILDGTGKTALHPVQVLRDALR